MYRLLLLLLLSLSLFCANTSQAAFKSANDEGTNTEAALNPAPKADDIILPMPCNGKMVLRAVNIPSGSLLHDRPFAMGIVNPVDNDRGLYERRFYGHISAPFGAGDLPAKWKANMGKKMSGSGDSWYFIGKYEVSRQQWLSVMDALDENGTENPQSCPRPGSKDASLPITGISWFSVQDFLNRYNAWLVKNHPDSLPVFAGTHNIAYLRLPTEEEWEYAARGGAAVPPEWWETNDIFPIPKEAKLGDYGIFNSGAVEKLSPIGSRLANPLGLHDTIGNAREMVDGYFHLSIADMRNGMVERRLHGAAGGILSKGGSFRNEENAVMPGWRDEVPLYTSSGVFQPSDLGFRLTLSALNIPNAQKLNKLRQEEKKQRSSQAKNTIVHEGDVFATIDALMTKTDGDVKKSLQKMRADLQEQENARASQDTRRLENSFRSLLYQEETLRAFAYRYVVLYREKMNVVKLLDNKLDAATRKKVESAIKTLEQQLDDLMDSLHMGANYFKTSLADLSDAPAAELDRISNQIKSEYGRGSVFNEHMRQNVDRLENFLRTARQQGLQKITQRELLQKILPKRHYDLLPKSMR